MKKQLVNPYLPGYEYIPDAEPRLFGDRVYIFGSHDAFGGEDYCVNDYVCWSAPAEDLKKVEGIGESAAVLLKVAGQIGRKARLADAVQSCPMTDVETAGAYLLERYAGETHEIVYELCLDRKGKLLACKRLNDGGASSAALDIRKVVENAILTSASTVILAHNHPSGIALPSDDDCAATTRAAQALQTIGVALADHIIVADDDFVSMAQSGYLTSWEHL